MHRFLTHEAIAYGLFDLDSDVAYANSLAHGWADVLRSDESTLMLLMSRMRKDYESLVTKMRKPFGVRELAAGLHNFMLCEAA